MFLARDRNRFTHEIQALVGRAASGMRAPEVDESAEKLRAANEALEAVVKPLFEAYGEMMRKLGRSCDFKVLPGSAESHPRCSAVADFLVDLSGVPGLAEYSLRLENDGGDWKLSTRPRLDGKGPNFEAGEIGLPANDKLPAAIEGALQQFIRLTF